MAPTITIPVGSVVVMEVRGSRITAVVIDEMDDIRGQMRSFLALSKRPVVLADPAAGRVERGAQWKRERNRYGGRK